MLPAEKIQKMIDTVALVIQSDKFITLDLREQGVEAWDLNSRTKSYEKYVKNPSAKDKQAGIYLPRLTGIKRKTATGGISSFLKIEFSIPKLIYGNNVDEVEEGDFPRVVLILKEKLMLCGIAVTEKELTNASVSTFHPSKNIALKDGYTASFVAKELSKINLNKKFDMNKTDFRNDGQSLQGYTLSHSVVFYDKVADLNKDKKRAIDKDQTSEQLSLFKEIKKQKLGLEIIRMEVRLSKKVKMNSVLEKLGFTKNPTFQDIFKKNVCQKIVRFYWDTLVRGENLFLFELAGKPKTLLRQILENNPNIKPKEAVYLVGLYLLCKEEGGIRSLRSMLEGRSTQRSWYRVLLSIKSLNSQTKGKKHHSWFQQIESRIIDFKPYRFEPA